jgi:isopenicillin N synthase-like dioxygenase
MAERKVPRIDYAKYRGGRAAGRREAVTVLGDSLRELGCVRLQGHAAADGAQTEQAGGGGLDPTGLLAVSHGVLDALAEYFGLPAGAFTAAAGAALERLSLGDSAGGELSPVPGLLLLLPTVPSGLTLRRGEAAWETVAAHPGELLAVAGVATERLTAGRVPYGALRVGAEPVEAWLLPAAAGAALEPLTDFAAS